MPTCEMCGKEESDLTSIRVDLAELEVCDGCSSVGTRLESNSSDDDSTDTKYSTSATADSESPADRSGQTGADQATNGLESESEMVSSLVPDYADRIQDGRNQSGLTVDELADRINEKASYIRKIERGEMQPDTTTQMQLEQFLNIELTLSDENEWLSDSYQQYDTN